MKPGPQPYTPPPDLHPLHEPRLASRIAVAPSSCWIWAGATTRHGYGVFYNDGKTTSVHRYTFQRLRGAIPPDLQIDHLCRTPRCVNPAHMELVTSRENTLRGITPAAQNAKKTTCPKCGGAYMQVGKKAQRRCVPCFNANRRAYYAPTGWPRYE